MKLHHFAAAAVLAVAGAQAFAFSPSESFDSAASTYVFSATNILAGDTSFTFTLDTSKGIKAGTYNIAGDISSTGFSFDSVKLGTTEWTLYAGSKGKMVFGDVELTAALPLTLTITGAKFSNANTAASFSGSLVMAPVPEPETYALMLAGLGAVGFVAYRRRSV